MNDVEKTAVKPPQAQAEADGLAVCDGLKLTATTVAGASMGVVGGVAAVAAAAFGEVIVPVGMCLWAMGLAGGAIGLLCGLGCRERR